MKVIVSLTMGSRSALKGSIHPHRGTIKHWFFCYRQQWAKKLLIV